MPEPTTPLRASPNFVQAQSFDGRAYVIQDSEPYAQYWLGERERRMLYRFGARGGATLAEVEAAEAPASAAERQRLHRAVAGMLEAGVLMPAKADTSRYDRRVTADYIAHRPYPQSVVQHIVQRAGIGDRTQVLDVAGGPGCLALALARHSSQVALLELSRDFLATARRRAREAGLPLRTLHDSANRLPQRDEPYDVITVSQALHWLDDVAVLRGAARLLSAQGHFFVVHTMIDVSDAHPLAWLLGPDSVLGAQQRQPFETHLRPLRQRLSLLCQALDAPGVHRIDPTQQRTGHAPLALAGCATFSQRRPFDVGFLRGFLTERHVAPLGRTRADVLAQAQAQCDAALPDQLMGTHHWGVLHCARGALDVVDEADEAIGYPG